MSSDARAIISGEYTILRKQKQFSKLKAAFFVPSVIYSAILSAVPSSFDKVYQISFTSGSGTLTDVKKDMTLYVGSAAGKYDYGMLRIRKTPIAGTFYVSEDSAVKWNATAGNNYLTVVNDFDLWARHIYIDSSEVVYVDRDITYSDQHTNYDPVVNFGCRVAVSKIETGASFVDIPFDFSNSYVIDSSISSRSCSCPGATSVTGGTTATPTIRISTAGWYIVYETVTAATGKTQTSIGHIYVWDDTHLPVPVEEIGDVIEDYDKGGVEFSFSVTSNSILSSIPNRCFIILFAEDYYDGTKVSLGQIANRENIVAYGRVARETLSISPEQSKITFEVENYQHWFTKVQGFPTGIEFNKDTSSAWTNIKQMTVDKAMFHFLHYRSTATTIMDFYKSGDTRYTPETSSPASNLWSQMQEFTFSQIMAAIGIDRYGRLFVNIEPQLVPAASRTWATVMAITNQDWQGNFDLDHILVDENSLVDLSGINLDSSGNAIALFSLSPGHVPKRYGNIDAVDRLLLTNQSLSNEFSGLYQGWKNNEYPYLPLILNQNNRMISCWPYQFVTLAIPTERNPRGYAISGNYIPRRVSYKYNMEGGFFYPEIVLEKETFAENYATGDVPGGGDSNTIGIPPLPPLPKLPSFPIILPGDIPSINGTIAIAHERNLGIVYTTNFNDVSPTWLVGNIGLSGLNVSALNVLEICPNGAVYAGYIPAPDPGSDYFLARALSIGNAFTAMSIPARLRLFAVNPTVSEQIGFSTGAPADSAWPFHVGTYSLWNTGIDLKSFRSTRGLSYGFGNWIATRYLLGGVSTAKISPDGTSLSATYNKNVSPDHIRSGTTLKIWSLENGVNDIIYSTDGLATGSQIASGESIIFTPDASDVVCTDVDPTGTILMGRKSGAGGDKIKSVDGGNTWASITTLPVTTGWFFHNLGDTNKWVASSLAVGNNIYITYDGGGSWSNKSGNLSSLTPFPAVDIVRVL